MSDIVTADQYPNPTLDGFFIQMGQGNDIIAVEQIIQQELGAGWNIQPFGDQTGFFDVTKPGSNLAVATAWETTYRLRANASVAFAEPVFTAAVFGRTDWNPPGPPPLARAPLPGPALDALNWGGILDQICMPADDLPASQRDCEWSIQQIRVPEAWATYFPDAHGAAGTNIVVGHPDTGYTLHPEIKDNLLIARGHDFYEPDDDAQDDLIRDGWFPTPGHGTGTASVIISPQGPPPGKTGSFVSGVAGGARLIPYRVSPSVVLPSTLYLAQAIEQAAIDGAQVISISMGGVFAERLHQAILFAQQHGVIVLAAAGNCVRFVVWPAAYDEVIAVAACDAAQQPWAGSSRGSAVDVTAPGAGVWIADVDAQGTPIVRQGSGTSYAVAAVAGLAALWLAYHTRQQDLQGYSANQIPALFSQILHDTCVAQTDPSWSPGDFGAGLVDAVALLAAPLPPPEVITPALVAAGEQGNLATFGHLFEQHLPGPAGLVAAAPVIHPLPDVLAEVLNTAPATLPDHLTQVGQELAFHLATDPTLYWQFAQGLMARSAPPVLPAEVPTLAPAAAAGAEHVAALRSTLLQKGVSAALQSRLTPPTG